MDYRPITDPQELDAYREMIRQAFAPDMSPAEQAFRSALGPLSPANSRGLYAPDGTLRAVLRLMDDGALYFGPGAPIPAALISAVVCPPEYRRQGAVKELFQQMYAEQRAAGLALSALYPFSFPFYRAFGYELAQDTAHYVVQIEQFKPWRAAIGAGRFVPAQFERDWPAMQAIYAARAPERLGMVVRDGRWWYRKWIRNQEFAPAYLYYDAAGRPAAYVIYYLHDKGDWVRDLVVRDMGAVDQAAQAALYGFLYNHDSQAQTVSFYEPVDVALAMQLSDPRAAEVRVEPGVMLRLLDVAGAFRRRHWAPEAQGTFTLAVTDAMIPENTGAYHITVRDGQAAVEPQATNAPAGVALDIRALSQLYAGYLPPARLAALGRITVQDAADLAGLQAVLSPPGQPAPYMADHF